MKRLSVFFAVLCAVMPAGCTIFDPSWSEGGGDAFRSRVLARHPVGSSSQLLREELVGWGFKSKETMCKSRPNLPICVGKYPEDRHPEDYEIYSGEYSGFIYGCTSDVIWQRDADDNIKSYKRVGIGCASL